MRVNEISMRGYKWNEERDENNSACYVMPFTHRIYPRKLLAFHVRRLACYYNANIQSRITLMQKKRYFLNYSVR